ncbi:MAG: hypothetical protein IKP20_00810 [Candidatus Methanomethylophilaceae archaeon]|nr:hypothetical protein [Candidatus Methanomethylophilaceae archaeon]
MRTGRRKRIMVACVTFETDKIVSPLEFYETNRIHLIHFSKDPLDSDNIYNLFYNRVVELIEDLPRKVEIVEHNATVYNFGEMLKTVLNILQTENRDEEGCEIYVNVSAGTSEYTAASTIASMMVKGTVPFTVNSQEFTVSREMMKEVYFSDGKPVGMTKKAGEPRTLPNYSIDMPEEHLVRGLRTMDRLISEKKTVSAPVMIEALKDEKIWYRDVKQSANMKTTKRQTEAVYYQRDFVSKWLRYGWIEKNPLNGKYSLTERGKTVIDTFYTV